MQKVQLLSFLHVLKINFTQLNMFHILKSEEKMRLIKYLFFALWKEAKTCDEQKMRFVIKLELKRVSKRS